MKHLLVFLIFLFSASVFSQIIGKVTDEKGAPLPFVNVFIENSYLGTTTNDDGNYKLDFKEKKSAVVVCQ